MYHARRTELDPPRRVLVIGSPGADKRRLGQEIAARLRIPLIDLEASYWRPGHLPPADAEWQTEVAELAGREEWVMVGTFPSTLETRVARADWLVLVDAPLPVCLFRSLRKMFQASPKPKGGARRVDFKLLRFVWSFPTAMLPKIHAIIARERRNRSIFILRSRRERDEFMARVPCPGDMGRGRSTDPPAS